MRRIAAILVLVPLTLLILAFAVANRQTVTVSVDPFNPEQPAYALTMWLFVPILAALVIGVVIGGVAAWLRHGRWRRLVRRMEHEAADLRREIDAQRRRAGMHVPQAIEPPERLKLKPPAA